MIDVPAHVPDVAGYVSVRSLFDPQLAKDMAQWGLCETLDIALNDGVWASQFEHASDINSNVLRILFSMKRYRSQQ